MLSFEILNSKNSMGPHTPFALDRLALLEREGVYLLGSEEPYVGKSAFLRNWISTHRGSRHIQPKNLR